MVKLNVFAAIAEAHWGATAATKGSVQMIFLPECVSLPWRQLPRNYGLPRPDTGPRAPTARRAVVHGPRVHIGFIGRIRRVTTGRLIISIGEAAAVSLLIVLCAIPSLMHLHRAIRPTIYIPTRICLGAQTLAAGDGQHVVRIHPVGDSCRGQDLRHPARIATCRAARGERTRIGTGHRPCTARPATRTPRAARWGTTTYGVSHTASPDAGRCVGAIKKVDVEAKNLDHGVVRGRAAKPRTEGRSESG